MGRKTLKSREIDASLLKKGFQSHFSKNGHEYYILTIDGKFSNIRTKRSMSKTKKDLGKPLIHKMAKQLKMTVNDFHRYVECTYKKDEYIENLKKNGMNV